MRLTCPSCGAVASLEAWTIDEKVRWYLKIISELPGPVAVNVPQYLGLFRDPASRRGLSWARVKTLLVQLKERVEASEIQWKNKAPRPNSARAWGMAMEKIIQNPPERLPLTSHGYLRAIAYDIADELHAHEEREAEESRRYPYHRVCQRPDDTMDRDTQPKERPGIPQDVKAELDRLKKKCLLNKGVL